MIFKCSNSYFTTPKSTKEDYGNLFLKILAKEYWKYIKEGLPAFEQINSYVDHSLHRLANIATHEDGTYFLTSIFEAFKSLT